MTRNRSKRGAGSVATLDIESKIAKSKRELQGVKRAISQVKREDVDRRGGDLFGKMPSMFVSVPAMLGGAEAYFQEITSATPKAFNNIFGKNKGSRQLQLEAFKQFEKGRDHDSKEQIDYLTLASTIVPLLAYNITQAYNMNLDAAATEIPAAVQAFQTGFATGSDTIDAALDRVVAYADTAPVMDKLSDLKKKANLIYPLNINYIKARDKMMSVRETSTTSKAKFLIKSDVRTAYRKYAAMHTPPMSVAVPSLIAKEMGSGDDAAKAKNLVAFFRESSDYSLEDTFNYYREAFNSVASSQTVRKSQEIAKGIRVIRKAFDQFIQALSDSMYDDSVAEAIGLRNSYFELVTPAANADDFSIATAMLKQAINTSPLVISGSGANEKIDLESLGYDAFSSLELIDLLNDNGDDVSAADADVWKGFHKIQQLNEELMDEALSVAEKNQIETMLADAITESSTADRLDVVDGTFKDFANGTLDDIVKGIVDSFNSGFKAELDSDKLWKTLGTSVGVHVAAVINGMFTAYTEDSKDVVSVAGTGPWTLKVEAAKLNESALLDLAEGESLDIYIESESDPNLDEFASSESELAIERLRQDFIAASAISSLNVKLAQYSELENFLRDCGLEAQSIFDSIHMEAERRDDIAIFRSNPGSFGTLAQAGIGALALVGTHATTALAQRFLNKDGALEGRSFYAAEYIPSILAAGAGAYMYHKEDRPDIGLPLIGGAIGSVILRMLTRKYGNKDNFVSKYILGYLGTKPAELLGDKTLSHVDLAALVNQITNAGNQLATAVNQTVSTVDPGVAQAVAPIIPISGTTDGYIEDSNTEMYQYPRMYAAPAGMGQYVSTPMHEPFYSYNPPSEITFNQAEQMLQQGYQLAGLDHQDAMDILQTAQPLGAHELQAEGLGGYVNETIIRATTASAQKLQNAGVAEAVAQSSIVPNSYLMKIGTTGDEGPIVPEYNPSLPSGTFAPQQIEPAQYSESVASGLFSRGAFASRLPSAEDGFDY